MNNQTNFNMRQMMSLGEWKEKVTELIRHSIIDIMKFRINSNACESSYLIENDYEHISHDSYRIQAKHENKIDKIEAKVKKNRYEENINEYSELEASNSVNFNAKNLEDSLRNKIIEKISDGYLYLNFSELDNFQHQAMEYIITISILFRRKDIKFVIENWTFEVNLAEEIYQEISKASKSQKKISLEGFNVQKRIYVNKKLAIFSKTIKCILNFLPAIRLFHGNSFDFFLDFEINFEEKLQKPLINHEAKATNLKNEHESKNNNYTNNSEKIVIDDDINDIENELDIFRMNSLKIKANQEIKKENTNIPIQRQIDLIKCLTNTKKIFHYYENCYTDKIGKIKVLIQYVDKSDVFMIEEEITKSISHLEKINKRKRFLSENSNDYMFNVLKTEGSSPNFNKNKLKKKDYCEDVLTLKNLQNSFLIDSENNSPSKNKKKIDKSINENGKFISNDSNLVKKSFNDLEQKNDLNLLSNKNNGNNNNHNNNNYVNDNLNSLNKKTAKLFENIIPNCSINNFDNQNKLLNEGKLNKEEKRLNSKSEEKNYSKNSPKNDITANEDTIINFSIRDYFNKNSHKNSTEFLNSDRTLSTKSSNCNNLHNYFNEENKKVKEKSLANLESLKYKLEQIHKITEDDNVFSTSSYEELMEESDDSSIELIIETEGSNKKHYKPSNLSYFIMKMNKLKNLLINKDTLKIDFDNFHILKNERMCLGK